MKVNNMKIKYKLPIVLASFLLLTFSIFADDDSFQIFTEESSSEEILFYAENNNLIPYYANISFPTLQNLNSSEALPYGVTIPSETSKMFLFKLSINNRNSGYSYSYEYIFVKGDPINTIHDDDYLYLLPFAHGAKFRVDQGYNGSSTHFGDSSYALDFNLETGTPIMAARNGIVVEIKEDSNIGGASRSYEDDGNFVLIYHNDGSFANYVHLQQNGALVEVGDHIKAGQQIALSGNTGYSSGPHLHFSVSIPTIEGRFTSIPTKFLNYDFTAISIQAGNYYYSTHPGKPEFEAIFGNRITNEDYNNYLISIQQNNDIEIRTEQIDNTILFFAKNGFNESYELTIDFVLSNLNASKELPIIINLKPLSENYICFLRANNTGTPWSYSYDLSFVPLEEIRQEANISNEFYENYSVRISPTDTFEIKHESIGDKVVFFFQNGFNKEYEIKITFSTTNLQISKEQPITFTIPPLTEVYICYFDWIDTSESWNCSTEYWYTEIE